MQNQGSPGRRSGFTRNGVGNEEATLALKNSTREKTKAIAALLLQVGGNSRGQLTRRSVTEIGDAV
jgi:hypothetical protein